jgi:hypothetical protein
MTSHQGPSGRVAALIFVAILAHAGSAASQEESDKEAAKSHFQNGLSMMELEDFAGAAVEFEASVSRFPTKNAMFNLGMCYKALHRYPQALRAFRDVLKQFGVELGDEMQSEVRKNIAAINKMIAQLEVQTNLPGAMIIVDGEKVGITPLDSPLELGAGEHRIVASLAGYQNAEQLVTMASQTRELVRLELLPAAIPGAGTVAAAPPIVLGTKGHLAITPGVIAPPRPGVLDGYLPPPGSIPPPSPPAGPSVLPKEGDRAAKIFGIGVGIQGLAGLLGIIAYYGSDSEEYLNNVGVWYFAATGVVSGVVTWLYGNGSYYYDVPIWGMYIGSLVGAGLGYLVDWLIWNQGMERRLPDITYYPEGIFGVLGIGIFALLLPAACPAIAYAIFRKPEARFRAAEQAPTPPSAGEGFQPAPQPESATLTTVSLRLTPPGIVPMRAHDGSAAFGVHLIGGSF